MILTNNLSPRRQRAQLDRINKDGQIFSLGAGKEVHVLVEGIYNGPNNKAQPLASPGDTITVSAGPYVLDLIRLGLVIAAEDYQEQETPIQSSLDDAALSNKTEPDPWDFWEEAGVTNAVAKTLYDAGFTSKAILVELCTANGLDGIIKLRGIGTRKANSILTWALASE